MADDRAERLRADLRGSAEYREQYALSALISEFSAQVQVIRRQRGLTQKELAVIAEMNQPQISALETPADGDKLPNWELQTLVRCAAALGVRLKITMETYGSLVGELDSVTAESLRRYAVESDPALNPPRVMPTPDAKALRPVQEMQRQMLPWLWGDDLQLDKLRKWLQGRRLPAVGHDEPPGWWVLRGIDVSEERRYLEIRLAERLALLVDAQPEACEPGGEAERDEFTQNLFLACAGIRQPAYLAEPLWSAYKRMKRGGAPGAVKDALEAAIAANQVESEEPLVELWRPMVEGATGRRWFRGSEIEGFYGILTRHEVYGAQMGEVNRALAQISNRWKGSEQEVAAFKLLWERLGEEGTEEWKKEWAGTNPGWTRWACIAARLPVWDIPGMGNPTPTVPPSFWQYQVVPTSQGRIPLAVDIGGVQFGAGIEDSTVKRWFRDNQGHTQYLPQSRAIEGLRAMSLVNGVTDAVTEGFVEMEKAGSISKVEGDSVMLAHRQGLLALFELRDNPKTYTAFNWF